MVTVEWTLAMVLALGATMPDDLPDNQWWSNPKSDKTHIRRTKTADEVKARCQKLTPLLDAIDNPDQRQRVAASNVFSLTLDYGDVEYLCKAAEDPRPFVRAAAVSNLGMFKVPVGEPPDLGGLLIRKMKDKHPVIRNTAVDVAMKYVRHDSRILPAVVDLFEDHENCAWDPKVEGPLADIVGAQIAAVWSTGYKNRAIYPRLMKMACDGSPKTQACVLTTLGRLAQHDREWQPVITTFLLKELQNAKPGRRQGDIANALAYTQAAAVEAVPTLVRILKNNNFPNEETKQYVAFRVFMALNAASKAGLPAVPFAIPLLEKRKVKYELRFLLLAFAKKHKEVSAEAKNALFRLANRGPIETQEDCVTNCALRALRNERIQWDLP